MDSLKLINFAIKISKLLILAKCFRCSSQQIQNYLFSNHLLLYIPNITYFLTIIKTYLLMNQISIYFVLLLIITFFRLHHSAQVTNTTNFFSSKFNRTITFQAYSGYQQINQYTPSTSSGMFYQLFSAHGTSIKQINPNIPLIIWIQGGGASSQFGEFAQIGPIKINKGLIQQNQWSWNFLGHLLFIDTPLNVGFSFYGNRTGPNQVNSSETAANHLVNFLCNFYKTWPSLLQNPLYLSGQSDAGSYINILARKLLTNTTIKDKVAKLQGITLGNAWVDPLNQLNFYDTYLWSAGIVANNARDIMKWYQTNSILKVYQRKLDQAAAYGDFFCSNDDTISTYFNNMDIFNFRNYKEPDLSYQKFLNQNKQQFGVNSTIQFTTQNLAVYNALSKNGDTMRSTTGDLIQVLRKVKVLIYQGQEDPCVVTPGVLQYLNSLTWQNILQWRRSEKRKWTINNQMRGWVKTWNNLWFVFVNKAGHLVPKDQPRSSFNMMNHFINGQNQWNL